MPGAGIDGRTRTGPLDHPEGRDAVVQTLHLPGRVRSIGRPVAAATLDLWAPTSRQLPGGVAPAPS